MLIIKCIIIVYIIVFLVYKLKHQFWSRQPVFHFHNLLYWIYPVKQIEKNNMKTDYPRYFDSTVKIKSIKNLLNIDDIVLFLQKHYAQDDYVQYSPTKENILSYLDENSIIAYKEKNNDIMGCVTNRSLNCFIKNHKTSFSLGYVDYLCVNKKFRGMGIAPRLIYTIYNYLKKNNQQICLFKREGVLAPIVPIVTYNTYCFELENTNLNDIIATEKLDVKILYDTMPTLKQKFKLLVIPPALNLLNMKNVIIMGIANGDCLFFFRETFTHIDNKPTIELFGSVSNNIVEEHFLMCFFGCLEHFQERMLIIENISDNNIIIKCLLKKAKTLFKSNTGYYFYNYAMKPLFSKDVLIIT